MSDSELKLFYSNAKGRAELIRLVLAAAGKQFNDVRFAREEWPKYKVDAPFGQMPYMEIDGKFYSQSIALATYFAREYGFCGKTNLESLQVDQVIQLIQDFVTVAAKMFHEKEEEKKGELIKTFKETDSPRLFGYVEAQLKENGTGYLVGSELSLADIAVYDFITGALVDLVCPLDNFPLVKTLTETVGQNERIKKYVAERPATLM
ncbi:probable glutathione S-transferase 7 [Aplysia californica]|uniref:Probable glutathione S-transferase 7 n=1 Tax=Aplysia californica TaxID=6500 RepID=A0ABM0JYK0_APLCA|nr:probable glutathione S-transferase 7 [Aplysia californica]